jgi:hypothetical protein
MSAMCPGGMDGCTGQLLGAGLPVSPTATPHSHDYATMAPRSSLCLQAGLRRTDLFPGEESPRRRRRRYGFGLRSVFEECA